MSFPLAVLCGAFFLHGVLRDTRPGGAGIAIDLGTTSSARDASFDAREEPHRLALTTVNHDPAAVGQRFAGALEVSLVGPGGRVAYRLTHPPDALAHAMPDNLEWTPLARFERLEHGRWTLRARVGRGDPRFAGKISHVLIRPERPDAGMGGLVAYAAMVPAIGFGALAMGLAIGIAARGGSRLPLALGLAAPPALWLLLQL